MQDSLLIYGAGIYETADKDITESIGCFSKISFLDDTAKTTIDGSKAIGNFSSVKELTGEYGYIVVAICNHKIRSKFLDREASYLMEVK